MSLKTNAPDWLERCRLIAAEATALDFHHDLGAVLHRIERDSARDRELEPGCAYRLIRLASAARREGYDGTARRAFELASEVVRVELSPSPDWATMCEEEGWL